MLILRYIKSRSQLAIFGSNLCTQEHEAEVYTFALKKNTWERPASHLLNL